MNGWIDIKYICLNILYLHFHLVFNLTCTLIRGISTQMSKLLLELTGILISIYYIYIGTGCVTFTWIL